MQYKDLVKTFDGCPFCKVPERQILREGPLSYTIINIAPYHKHHSMIIPKRHIEKILDATDKENKEMLAGIKQGIEALNKLGYKSYVAMIHEGGIGVTGGSVPHLHYHLIPDTPIGMLEKDHEAREIIPETEMATVKQDLKIALGA
ncbi:MAG TPA: HIT domain-containing protein [Candidatus Paceibacterota bacterium]